MKTKISILIVITLIVTASIFSCTPETANLQLTIDGNIIQDLSQAIELFTDTPVNTTATKHITVGNTGRAPLTLQEITITNSSQSFDLDLTDIPANTTIMPRQQKDFIVSFTPTTATTHTATIHFVTVELGTIDLDVTGTTLNNDADLSALTLSAGTLDPVFDANTLSYDAGDVGVTPIDVTATLNDTNASLTINGNAATSGTAESIALTDGSNTITIIATAEDTTTQKTYTITVNKLPPSNDADLSALTLSAGTLDPVFDANTLSYDAGDVGVTPIDVTATTNDANATMTINGNAVTSGIAESIALSEGSNTITIVVTAEDTTTQKTYTITVNKTVPSNDANLSALTLSAGTLDPVFDANTLSYDAGDVSVTPIDVTATLNDTNATMTINSTAVTSGVAESIALSEGSNTITIIVTAEDTTTQKTYTITVNKISLSNDADLSALSLSVGTLNPAFDASTISYNAGNVIASTVDVTATTNDANATMTINSSTVTSGVAESVGLSLGSNTITIIVTAEDTTTQKTYTVSITRDPATNYSFIVSDDNGVEIGGFIGSYWGTPTLMTSTGYILYISYDGAYAGSQIWFSGVDGTGDACLNDGSSAGGYKMYGKTIIYAAHNGTFWKPTTVETDGTSISAPGFLHESIVQSDGGFSNYSGDRSGWRLTQVTDIATEFGIPATITAPLVFDHGDYTQYVNDGSGTMGTLLKADDWGITLLTSTSHIVDISWDASYGGSQIYFSGLDATGNAFLNSGGSAGVVISGKTTIYDAYHDRFYKLTNVDADGTSTSVSGFARQSIVYSDGTYSNYSNSVSGWYLTEVPNPVTEFGIPSSMTTPITLSGGATIPTLSDSGSTNIGTVIGADMYGIDVMTSNFYQVGLYWDGAYAESQIYFSGANATGDACLNDGGSSGQIMYGKSVIFSLGYNSGATAFFKPTTVTNGYSVSADGFSSQSIDNYGNVSSSVGTQSGWRLSLVSNITTEFALPASITAPLTID